jgi:hypothetical protein
MEASSEPTSSEPTSPEVEIGDGPLEASPEHDIVLSFKPATKEVEFRKEGDSEAIRVPYEASLWRACHEIKHKWSLPETAKVTLKVKDCEDPKASCGPGVHDSTTLSRLFGECVTGAQQRYQRNLANFTGTDNTEEWKAHNDTYGIKGEVRHVNTL